MRGDEMQPASAATHVQVRGRDVTTGRWTELGFAGDTIATVTELEDPGTAGGPWVGPGLVDLQINGYRGHDFNHAPLDHRTALAVSAELPAQGITAYLPTLISNTEAATTQALHTIAATSAAGGAARVIAGVHLEGPFISDQDGPRGAHDRSHVRPPDWDLFARWQEAAEGCIRVITLSPEWAGSAEFIERCVDSGVTVSIGHTAASPDQINEAVSAGASMSTHLGNGTHLTLARHPNYLWQQLASDELWASLIADGIHLPDSVLKVMLRVKGSRALLVSDAVCVSGLEPGEYGMHIGGRVVLTHEDRLHLADQPALLAGSVVTLPAAVSYLVTHDLADMAGAWAMASTRPSTAVGLPAAPGIAPGAPADVVVFDWDAGSVRVHATYKGGELVYGTATAP